MFAGNRPLVGFDCPLAIRCLTNAVHGRVAMDFGAHGPRAAGERLGEIGGLHIAIIWMANGTDEIILDRQRPKVDHLVWR